MAKEAPMRQCTACREMKPKGSLIRVVKSPEAEISLDFKGRAAGRGAYLCPNPACLMRAKKTKALSRAFKMPIPEEIYAQLEKQMEESCVR